MACGPEFQRSEAVNLAGDKEWGQKPKSLLLSTAVKAQVSRSAMSNTTNKVEVPSP